MESLFKIGKFNPGGRENIIKREGKCITFMRDDKAVNYYDLDDGIDVPSDINILLWKDTK